ncbi:hypothetical protein HK101_005388, partial [Irineochytrium annulatum]
SSQNVVRLHQAVLAASGTPQGTEAPGKEGPGTEAPGKEGPSAEAPGTEATTTAAPEPHATAAPGTQPHGGLKARDSEPEPSESELTPITATTLVTSLAPSIEGSIVKNLLKISEEGHCYFPLRSLMYATPDKVLRMILTRGLYDLFPAWPLATFLIVYLVLSIGTYYIALPTDLVIPNLILGALAGRLLGLTANGFKHLLSLPPIDPGLYSLLGLAALWSGTSRLVITVTVISLEITGDFDTLPALLIVSFTAAWTSSLLDQLGWGESLYHTEMELNGTPFLPHEPPHALRTVAIGSCIRKQKLVVLSTTATVADGLAALESPHNGYPVVEVSSEPANGLGGVNNNSSSTLDNDAASAMPASTPRYRPVGFIQRDRLAEVLDLLRVDGAQNNTPLEPSVACNASPTVVTEVASASKVFRCMRSQGLRHVLVVDGQGWLRAVVTRKDLIRAGHSHEAKERARKRKMQGGVEEESGSESEGEEVRGSTEKGSPEEVMEDGMVGAFSTAGHL